MSAIPDAELCIAKLRKYRSELYTLLTENRHVPASAEKALAYSISEIDKEIKGIEEYESIRAAICKSCKGVGAFFIPFYTECLPCKGTGKKLNEG